MERVFCTNCGAENDSSRKFCTNCGAPLDKSFLEEDAAPEEPSTPFDEAPIDAADEIGSDAGFFVGEEAPHDDATRYMPPSPSVPEEPVAPAPREKRPSTGTVVGIVLGVVAAVAVVGFALFYFLNPLGLTTGIFENSAAAQAAAAEEAQEQAAQAQAEADATQTELEKAQEAAQQKEKELQEAQKAQKEAEEAQKEAEEAAKRAEEKSVSNSNSPSGVHVGSNGIEYTHHMKTGNSSDFILPESDSRTYSNSELEALSNYELYLARNEIFARYGRKYSEESLSTYLNGTDWYQPLYDGAEFDEEPIENYMNEFEYKNAIQMLDIERARESEYLSY